MSIRSMTQRVSLEERRSERGEGNLGNLAKLAIFAILAVAAYQSAPVYMDNFKFQDRLTEIARSQPPNAAGNESAVKLVAAAIEELGLSEYLTVDDCTVTSQGGLGGTRTITCRYSRTYKMLGSNRTASFNPSVSQPMF